MDNNTCYGIDLGTTYSCIAKYNRATNLTEIIKDQDLDSDTLASAIYFSEDGVIYHGEEAKEAGVASRKRLCEFFKRYIGRDDLAQKDKDKVDGPHYMFEEIDGKLYTPVQLSSMVLQKIVDYAKASGEDVKDVVITCPAYFDNAQREATRSAAESIGLNVIKVVNEPTAAALHYYADKLQENMTILVYDLGGGTFDISIVKIGMNDDGIPTVEVLTTEGDDRLGGKDWDNRLYDIIKAKFETENDETYQDDSDAAYDIRRRVEKAKIDLSKAAGLAKVTCDDVNGKIEVTRDEFESATKDLVEKTIRLLELAIKSAGLTYDDIDKVLMVGGSTKMPMIPSKLKSIFGDDKVIFNDPNTAVALGAAIIAEKNYASDALQKIFRKDYRIVIDDNNKVSAYDKQTGKLDEEMSVKLQKLIDNGGVEVNPNPGYPGSSGNPLSGSDSPNGGIIVETDNGSWVTIAPPKVIIIDVIARTFGLVVLGDDNTTLISDNVVKKGDKAPITVLREYSTPRDGMSSISLPVVESLSLLDRFDVYIDNETFSCSDDKADLKLRNTLILDVGTPLPIGTPLYVTFSVAQDGQIDISMREDITGTEKKIDFKYTNY